MWASLFYETYDIVRYLYVLLKMAPGLLMYAVQLFSFHHPVMFHGL